MSNRIRNVLIVIGVLSIIGFLTVILVYPVDRYEQVRCREQLKAIGYAVQVYKSDHGQLPHQISVLSNELINPDLLICPGSGHTVGNFSKADSWADYTFIDWFTYFGTNSVPTDYPLLYDHSLSDHDGEGINICDANGYVHWDPHAEWLKKFAVRHSNYTIPIPK